MHNRCNWHGCCMLLALWCLMDWVRVMVMDVIIVCFKWVTEGIVNDWAIRRLTLGNLGNGTASVCRMGSDEWWCVWW